MNCQQCSAKSQLPLCNTCQNELHDMLLGLPRWINYLADAIIGDTRMGDGGRRTGSDEAPLKVNLKASRIADDIHTSLKTRIADICETRAIPNPALRSSVQMAQWLANNIPAITAHETAGHIYTQIHAHITAIEKVINRPIPPRYAGPCPTIVTDPDTHRKRECGTRLMAPRHASQVRCRECKTEHDVERIISRLLANVDHWRFTREELTGSRTGDWTGIMGLLDEPVSKSTFHKWSKDGSLKPNGYRRPDGTNGIARHSDDDQPLYRLSRVRRLRTQERAKQSQAMRWARDTTPA
jgi:hypothetical protein